MKAILLAAGRGDRMRPLTDNTAKPLLKIRGQALIAYHLKKLAEIGVEEVVINTHYFADQIQTTLGSGEQFGLKIHYSYEQELLETGGGIYRALPILGDEPFLVISGDVFTDFPFEKLQESLKKQLAHLILVNNPDFNLKGDFSLGNRLTDTNESDYYWLQAAAKDTYTYASFGVFHPKLFALKPQNKTAFRLTEILNPAIQQNLISGEIYSGVWHNLGTPQQLQALETELNQR